VSAKPESLLHCSFCGKPQTDVAKLIAGPGVYICNHCIDLCNEIITDEVEPRTDLDALRKASARVDAMVQSLKEDGVPWSEIAAALRKEEGE